MSVPIELSCDGILVSLDDLVEIIRLKHVGIRNISKNNGRKYTPGRAVRHRYSVANAQ